MANRVAGTAWLGQLLEVVEKHRRIGELLRGAQFPLTVRDACGRPNFNPRDRLHGSFTTRDRKIMAKLFGNLGLVLIVGLILAILEMATIHGARINGDQQSTEALLRWFHVFFGITWIGLLYYFNFVQTPVMPTIPAELKPGVSKYIAPKALFYFRWSAAFTVLVGLLLAWNNGYIVDALTLQPQARLIGCGMWLSHSSSFNG